MAAHMEEFQGRRRRNRHLEVQVDILARELYFQVFLKNQTSGQRYLDADTTNLYRISIHVCEHSGLAHGAMLVHADVHLTAVVVSSHAALAKPALLSLWPAKSFKPDSSRGLEKGDKSPSCQSRFQVYAAEFLPG